MRLILTLVLLATAGSAAALEAPVENVEDDLLVLDIPLLGSTRVGIGATQERADAARTAAHSGSAALLDPAGHEAREAPAEREHASHDARDEPAPDMGGLRDDLPAFVQPAIAEVESAVVDAAEPVGFFASLGQRLSDSLSFLAPEGPAASAAGAAREAATDAGASAQAAAVAAATVAAPGAAMLAGTAATVVPGTSLASDAWRRLRHLLLGVAGYTRLSRARLLDQEARNAIHAAVRDNPGVTTPNLARTADVGRTTATYHLRVLEREGYVVSRVVGRSRHWFPVGEARDMAPEALALLQHPTTGRVAGVVKSTPGIDQSTLCAQLGLSPSLAHWHLDRLAAAGLVTKARDGRRVRYHPVA